MILSLAGSKRQFGTVSIIVDDAGNPPKVFHGNKGQVVIAKPAVKGGLAAKPRAVIFQRERLGHIPTVQIM